MEHGFFVPGEFTGFARAGRNTAKGITFTPKKQRSYSAVLKDYGHAYMTENKLAPFTGAVSLHVVFNYIRPASWSKKKIADTRWKTSRPDIDNLVKLIMDSLNGIVWTDDAIIAWISMQKIYGPTQGTSINFSELE